MKRFALSFKAPSIALPKWFLAVFLGVALLGFLDATYLAAKHFLGEPPNCTILAGCEEVTSSPYATFGGVPVALVGAAYYLLLLLAVVAFIDTKWRIFFWIMTRFTLFGFLASIWFVSLQLFVIRAICLYCMGSAVTSALLFLLSLYARLRWDSKRGGEKKEEKILTSV